MHEKLKEEVKYFTEWIKLLIIIELANISSVAALMRMKNRNEIESLLLLFGIFTGIAFAVMIFALNYFIRLKLKKLKQ